MRLYTHTHTHTIYCLLVNKENLKIEYKNKDRTMLKIEYIGLSLSTFGIIRDKSKNLFLEEKRQEKIINKKYRAGPKKNKNKI